VSLTRELLSREQRRRRKTSDFAYHGVYHDYLPAASHITLARLRTTARLCLGSIFRRSLVSGLRPSPYSGVECGSFPEQRLVIEPRLCWALVCVVPTDFRANERLVYPSSQDSSLNNPSGALLIPRYGGASVKFDVTVRLGEL